MHCAFSASISLDRFTRYAEHLARTMDGELLLSADGYPTRNRSIIGVQRTSELHVTAATTPADIKAFCFGSPGPAIGFLSYTYGMLLRGIPSEKPLDFPLGHLKKYAAIITYENEQLAITTDNQSLEKRLIAELDQSRNCHTPAIPSDMFSAMTASLGELEYEDGVRRTLEYIKSGHTYQLNLTTRLSWHCPNLDPLAMFITLYRSNPAPFYAWFTSGDQRILSTSPERFLTVREGHVLSQPIKGTLRFETLTPDLYAELTDSPKESAELSMIVDLVRNDISANCEYGSVHVENHKSIFAVDNLLQMYADVHGTLKADRDCLDLFLDAFPGGSITGCPKRSSMEIIERLEPHSRGIYCGSIFIIEDERTMESSIAIRTATYDIQTQQLNSYAGSGIVVDSDPVSEYHETMAKAEKFTDLGAL
ncbi:anthranilate synthase component I family protein [Pseudodesulfovibrio sp. JC047]|uniref:anthranilate synthase component I family protein n=1 Tax=Pseudodesulfovibrio sp. JC047 TaxID=2683199 RepID=UPI0013D08D3C|nr:anthranilate synthase component I family protein [Pseudodesulfovibrio sp. JC047]NDV19940.1 anthranilate synthase component I family protein [Pseudodesulfovibrio sp. JC047]